jgi:hypothetical protein
MQHKFSWRRMSSAIFISLFCAGLPAAAQTGPVQVALEANIPPRCGFLPGTLVGQSRTPDLEAATRFDIQMMLDCNTPYAFGVVAQNGRLENLDAAPDGSGFAFAKFYQLSVALETDLGVIRSARCRSDTLVVGGSCAFAAEAPGSGLSSRHGISVNRAATLTVEWPDQSITGHRLAAGRYRDTLILVVGPRA